MSPPRFVIEKLSSRHDRSAFDCGVEELNAYLKKYSGQHERRGISRTYVAVEEGEKPALGYHSISSGAVAFDTVPENLPRHPVPVALIGRLAVDKRARGHGLGEMLLVHGLRSAQKASEAVGIYAVVVDSWDEAARKFYLKYGFNELKDDRLHLYLSMRVIRQLLL